MVKVCGEAMAAEGKTVAALLKELEYDTARVAVEVNEEIVPKKEYDSCILQSGDVVEIVSFVGGG